MTRRRRIEKERASYLNTFLSTESCLEFHNYNSLRIVLKCNTNHFISCPERRPFSQQYKTNIEKERKRRDLLSNLKYFDRSDRAQFAALHFNFTLQIVEKVYIVLHDDKIKQNSTFSVVFVKSSYNNNIKNSNNAFESN
jgi:hypothetical protein